MVKVYFGSLQLLLVGVSSAPSCCIVWDRDRAALARLPVLHLERLESIHDDAKHELGTLVTKFKGFQKRHRFLSEPVPQWSGEP
jgi:hypothetical protein